MGAGRGQGQDGAQAVSEFNNVGGLGGVGGDYFSVSCVLSPKTVGRVSPRGRSFVPP